MKTKNLLLLSASFLLLASCGGDAPAPEVTIEEAQTISKNAQAKYAADEVTIPSDFSFKSVTSATVEGKTSEMIVEVTSAITAQYFHVKTAGTVEGEDASIEQYVFVRDGVFVIAAAMGEEKMYQESSIGADALFDQTVAEIGSKFDSKTIATDLIETLTSTIDNLIDMMPADIEGEVSYPEGVTNWSATCRSSGEGNLSVEANVKVAQDDVKGEISVAFSMDNYLPQSMSMSETAGADSMSSITECHWGNVDLVYPNAADFKA